MNRSILQISCLCVLIYMIAVATCGTVCGQELINGTYNFQSDPAKKYTLYVPSAYQEGQPTALMLGLHPFNTAWWDSESWCDTLSDFAEANDLLLVCPDGGPDGRIDDAIDTAFTSFLLDEIEAAYTVDADAIYAVGFSWGAKTVYTYGLQHADRFAGFVVVGAAVTSSEVVPLVELASDKAFYIIHGGNDSPQVRYTPIVDLLEPHHCVESILMPGVGHTIDFADRNSMLTTALEWVRSVHCGSVTLIDDVSTHSSILRASVVTHGSPLLVTDRYLAEPLSVFNIQGQVVAQGPGRSIALLATGMYIVITAEGHRQAFVVVD